MTIKEYIILNFSAFLSSRFEVMNVEYVSIEKTRFWATTFKFFVEKLMASIYNKFKFYAKSPITTRVIRLDNLYTFWCTPHPVFLFLFNAHKYWFRTNYNHWIHAVLSIINVNFTKITGWLTNGNLICDIFIKDNSIYWL